MFETQVRRYVGTIHGLPPNGQAVIVTNSSLKALPCRRQFFFAEIERLRAPGTRRMDAGNAWDTVISDVYTWWMLHDRPYPTNGLDECVWCSGNGERPDDFGGMEPCAFCATGESVIAKAMRKYHETVERDRARDDGFVTYSEEELEKTEETLRRMLDGYLVRFHGGPLQSMKIVAVQPMLARQIVNPRTGKPFRGQTLLEELPNGDLVVAGSGAIHRGANIRKVTWPWYLLGMLDALAADRRTNMGTVIDAKASVQPSRYHDGIPFDPQLPGYCWLVEAHLEAFGLSGVEGFLYDVTHGKFQPDPDELQWKPPKVDEMKEMCVARGIETKGAKKSEDYMALLGITPGHGGFSKKQNSGVPSWRYRRAVEAAGLDLAEYEEHIEMLADTVDRGLYRRDAATFADERRTRFGRETYAKAALVAALRRSAAGMVTADEQDIHFDREPICTIPGGSCAYKGPCAMDAPETRAGYDVAPSQVWGEDVTTRAAPNDTPPDTDTDTDGDQFDW